MSKTLEVRNCKKYNSFIEFNGVTVTFDEMTRVLQIIDELGLDVESNGELGFRHDDKLYVVE